MTNADWATKDFYQTLASPRTRRRPTSRRPTGRARQPPRLPPGDAAAEERFKAVAEAYDVVGDPEKRTQYDELRTYARGPFAGGRSGGGAGQPFDLGDLFGGGGGGGGGLGDLFGGVFGQGGRTTRTSQPRRGADLETETTLGFSDAVEGTTVSLRLSSDAPCRDCNGTGARAGTMPRVCPECEGVGMRAATVGGAFTMNETCPACHGRGLVVDDPCPTCHGSGRGLSNRTVSARIPAGVKDGQKIRLRGKGAGGERGGPSGDLFVTVHVTADRLFGRKGDNLTLTVPVSFDEAALGAELKVPTLNGPAVTVKIPSGTPNGRTFRVRGRGVARSDGSKGDLLVSVDVQVPAQLSEAAQQAVEAYRAATTGSDPRAALFQGGAR